MTDRRGPDGPETDEPAVPDLVLERARLGELPAGEREALTRRLDREPKLRERLAAIELSDGALRHRLEAAQLATRLRARLSAPGEGRTASVARWRAWPLPAGLAVAATAALVLSLRTSVTTPRVDPGTPSRPAPTSPGPTSTPVPVPPSRPQPPVSSTAATRPSTGEPGVRLKGVRPALALFRKTAEGSETLADGDAARAGDLIRIGYRSLGRRYGVIVSLDGRGGLTRHLPDRGAAAAALEARDVVLLGHAYQLDDAPAWERFFFVTANAPFAVATVEEAARKAASGRTVAGQAPADLPLPSALEQSTFLLTKE